MLNKTFVVLASHVNSSKLLALKSGCAISDVSLMISKSDYKNSCYNQGQYKENK